MRCEESIASAAALTAATLAPQVLVCVKEPAPVAAMEIPLPVM
jgi:hypothetical protein